MDDSRTHTRTRARAHARMHAHTHTHFRQAIMEESSTDAAGSKHIPDDWVDATLLPAPVMAVSDTLRRMETGGPWRVRSKRCRRKSVQLGGEGG